MPTEKTQPSCPCSRNLNWTGKGLNKCLATIIKKNLKWSSLWSYHDMLVPIFQLRESDLKKLEILTVIFIFILYGCSLKKGCKLQMFEKKVLDWLFRDLNFFCGCLSFPHIIWITFLNSHLLYTSNKLVFWGGILYILVCTWSFICILIHRHILRISSCLHYVVASNIFFI
jgi:hypothetical protein